MNPITGLSFYDSLNKLVVGWLVILPFFANVDNPFRSPINYVIAFIVGLIFQCLMQKITNGFRNPLCMIRDQNIYVADKNNITIGTYYKAYYRVAKEGLLMNIPILEAHENFIRNCLPITILYNVELALKETLNAPLFKFVNKPFDLAIGLAFAIVPLIFSWIFIQNKIFHLVWEGDHYLSEFNNLEKDAKDEADVKDEKDEKTEKDEKDE